MEDLYKRIQVDPQAEAEVIRAAYHALARKHHPDAGGDTSRMVKLNEAWAVLGNPRLRAAYDARRARPSPPPANPAAAPSKSKAEAPPRSKLDSSTILDFGRYEGWSLQQVVQADPDYLEWLVRTPIGRRLTAEARNLLAARAGSRGVSEAAPPGAGSGSPGQDRKGRGLAGRLRFG